MGRRIDRAMVSRVCSLLKTLFLGFFAVIVSLFAFREQTKGPGKSPEGRTASPTAATLSQESHTPPRPEAPKRSIASTASKPVAMPAQKPRPTIIFNLDPQSKARVIETYGRLPLRFETNQGQTDERVNFLSRGPDYTLFLTRDEAVFWLRKPLAAGRQAAENQSSDLGPGNSTLLRSLLASPKDNRPRTGNGMPSSIGNLPSPMDNLPEPSVLQMKLVGANPDAKVSGLDELPGRSNYFIGNDPNKWRTNVANYAQVKYESVYPGIDLVYYGNQRQLEYDFVVAPGADPFAIRLAVETGNSKLEDRQPPAKPGRVRIDSNGDLVIATDAGDVRLHKPVVYQPQLAAGSVHHSSFSIHHYCPVIS